MVRRVNGSERKMSGNVFCKHDSDAFKRDADSMDRALPIGKLPNRLLAELIRPLASPRSELLRGPAVGEDCAIMDFGVGWIAATTDPITGSDKEIGRLGIHVSLNDLACAGAEPVAVLVTLLCPPGSTEGSIREIMMAIRTTTESMGVALAGGHTEITNAVNRMVINVTALGRTPVNGAISTAGAKPGDALVMTKAAGLEGTAILAHEKEMELTAAFGADCVNKAKGFMDEISVVREGLLAAANGVHAMHDVTEGGILGAVWELCAASGVGAILEENAIPVRAETMRICEHFGLNPLRLISSGSMLMACPDGEEMVKKLMDAGIAATVIGKVSTIDVMPSGGLTADRLMADRSSDVKYDAVQFVVLQNDLGMVSVEAPEADEIYKVLT
jgi:hydrogenase maturation factor